MGLRYRPVELDNPSDARRWRDWVLALKGRSGVYVIATPGGWLRGRTILYVGESHTGRLYDTLTRHFRRWKGATAGLTYTAGRVEVAAVPLSPARARETQRKLIHRLRPRDNSLLVVDDPEVPF